VIDVWSVAGKRISNELPGHPAEVIGASFDAGDRIVSADTSGNVKVWSTAGDVSTGTTILSSTSTPNVDFVISRDGQTIGAAEMDGGLLAWRLDDLRRTVVRQGSGQMDLRRIARSLAITPDGRQLLAAENDLLGTVRAWSLDADPLTAWELNKTLVDGCGKLRPTDTVMPASPLSLTPDGRAVVYGAGQCVVVRDLATQNVVATLRHHAGSFVFRPDGTLLLTSYYWVPQPSGKPGQARVMIWDWRHDKVLADVPTATTRTDFENGSWRASISADGRYIAVTGARPSIVAIWDGDLRQELGRLPVPVGTERTAFSADGGRMATFSADSTVRIWDTERRQLLLILTDDERHDGGLAFTADGRLIAGRSSGGLTIWDSARRAIGLPVRR
jgi:WD40 repeat protein